MEWMSKLAIMGLFNRAFFDISFCHRNSGVIGGKFLERTRVPKPGCSVDNPEFYHPNDFSIGASVVVFNHNFVITDADMYVVKYMEEHSADFATETISSLRQRHGTALRETGAR